MNEIILNYIVQAILGGASGYITNDYALNMLFKEYTPLKIGGVIKKTRPEFIENLSDMVDKDIINKEKLHEILSDESFIKEFENLTVDFYENCLYETTGSDSFAEIDGFTSTIKSTDIFVAKIINEHMPDIYNLMIENLNSNDFLSAAQLNKISDSLYKVLTDIFKNSDIIENMLISVFKNNDKLIINNILDKDVYETVINNSVEILVNAASEKSDSELMEIFNTAGFGNALNSSKEVFYKRKIKDVVNLSNNTLKSINIGILNYVNSEIGTNNINSLINSLFSYGKKIDKSVFQLLDTTFEENLKNYLIKNIPDLTENIVNWLNENSHLIDHLIEEAIDEVIKESDGLKAKLLSTIKNAYFSSLSKKYSIVDKIISFIEKISDPEKLSENISTKLIDILNNLTIREIIIEAENNNINPDNAVNFIINYINNYSETLISKSAQFISEIEIQKILPHELINDELKTIFINKLKELATSNTFKNYLTNKSTDYIDNLFSKELDLLIDDEKAEFLILKLKDVIKENIISNELIIKRWIENQIIDAADKFSSKTLNLNLSNQFNENLYENYNKLTDELQSVQISTALDKLNSIENLAKNSSESLRSYASNNTDVILSGSIKAVVQDNLNKLNDDELVDLANDFIGRELKPIMYFGGVLGVTAGLILAAFQSSPLDPAEINIANMAVYAFVGYITNVVAINMIFKPYKENRILSKIPFLHNFSLGYIVKNQKTFAKNTSHFIDNSLLSKKSINGLFDKYKDKIKNSFFKSIAENDYKTISNLLKNNKHSVVKGVFLFLKNKVSTNINIIINYLYSKYNNIKVSSLIDENALNIMSSSMTNKLQSSDITGSVYSIINSSNSLESLFSSNVIKEYISKSEDNYYEKISAIISDENEFKTFILKYDNKYQKLSNKQLNEIINQKSQEKLACSAAEKINSIILSKDSRDNINQKALNLINKYINKNKTFEEIFDGKFKDYVNSHMPQIFEKVLENIKKNVVESKSKIAVKVQSEIKNSLGFIEKGMYTLMGGDEIVDELLTKIITVKIPKFLDYKKQELSNIASNLLEEKLYTANVEILFTGLNMLQFNELIDNYLNPVNSARIENRINKLTTELFNKTGNLRLNNILTLFNINNLNSFVNEYSNEINAFSNELSLNLKDNKIQISDKVTDFTNSLIDEFMKTKIEDIFKGTSKENLKSSIDKIVAELNKNHIDKIIYSALENSKDYIKDIKIGELICKEEFEKFSEHYFITLMNDKNFEDTVKVNFEAIIDEAVSLNFSFVDVDTKKYVLNIFVDSIINSLKRNLNEMLKAVEFDKIAQEEIEKMEPKKIHEMFDSFGGKYFKRLMIYGLGGFVFGINMYVGMALTLLKILSELVKKND